MSRLHAIWTFFFPEKATPRTVVCAMCDTRFNTAGRPKADPCGEAYWTEKYCTKECAEKKRGGGDALADAMDATHDRFEDL